MTVEEQAKVALEKCFHEIYNNSVAASADYLQINQISNNIFSFGEGQNKMFSTRLFCLLF